MTRSGIAGHARLAILATSGPFLFLASAAMADPPTATVMVADTVSTKDVDNALRSPFQTTLCTAVAFGQSAPSCGNLTNALTTDSNRRTVIEFVSADCSTGGTLGEVKLSLATTAGGVRSDYRIPLGRGPLSPRALEAALSTRIYADPGTVVGLGFTAGSDGANPGSVKCELAISGHTVAM